jgi:hypothetical protein
MKYLTRVLAYTRLLVLLRHWKPIQPFLNSMPVEQEARLAALVYDEALRAEQHPTPQFYGSDNVESYSPWGDAVETAFARSRSADAQEQLRGVAVWLAVVYHETRNGPIEALRKLHVDVAYDFERLRSRHEHFLAIRKAA